MRTPFATVALSSLTEEPIASAPWLLLTAVGRAGNTGSRYNVLHTRMLEKGNGPIRIEPVEAGVRLRAAGQLPVRPVAADGTRGEPLPTRYEDGWLSFAIGAAGKTIYYEIGRRPARSRRGDDDRSVWVRGIYTYPWICMTR